MKTAIADIANHPGSTTCRIGNRRNGRFVPQRGMRCGLPVRGKVAGFTIVEMVLVAGIFGLLATWMVSSQIFGLRIYTLAATKLVATSGARQVINSLRNQIQEANTVYIGNCSGDWQSYVDITNGNQAGNAVEIYPTSSTNDFLICYLDTTTSTNRLLLYNRTLGNTNDLCDYITNLVVFDAEDYAGNILTNNQNNRVIRITMQMSQWEYPIARIGGTNFNHFDFYQLRTKATRRAIN